MALPNDQYPSPMSEVDPKRRVAMAKNVAAGYTLTNLLKSEEYMDKIIELLEKRIGEFADTQKPVELREWFYYLSFDIVGEMAFSSPFGFLQSGTDIGGSVKNASILPLYATISGFFLPLHRSTLGNPLLMKFNFLPANHIFDTTMSAIERRRKSPEVRFDVRTLEKDAG